ncbi:penicillin-binding protein, beta-lactamase class C [Mycolicibacterium chubuense NBB4]|uniref:Penicillin-binding protein, beta-lactamase class C n=1 Tax=Mycolicibacterium chubuense (strain NBB4) TaxID=710421 RepID=I4BP78_MYCCN|nr:serine hydrolase [Mycolicibacterium chubuense]AFM19085.1 penicillin-binding protein, beta-lactamase class C [Mycolicibacterium chubuense NBB4]
MNPPARVAVLVSLVALLAACGSDSTRGADTTPSPSSQSAEVPPPLMPAMPLPDNAVADAVAELDGMAEALMTKSGIPGMAVAVVHGGKTVYAKGFGVKNTFAPDGAGNRVDADTVFQLASLSKPLSATVVARQVSRNAITWDTPIVSRLPWFALSDPAVTKTVTVGDMFSHRSGLPDHAGDRLEDLGYDRRQVLERLRQLPLAPFRISYAYTNFGLTAGAEAVAAAAGEDWETLAQDELFGPLGMASTSYRFTDFQARRDRAVGHIHVDGRYEPRYVRDPQAQSPAGGVSSSVNDMTRWMTMMLADGQRDGAPFIDPKALLPALTPQIVSSRGSEPSMRSGFYGYGFNVGTTSGARTELSHSGAFELGAGSNVLVLPSADVAIVALTNATPAGVPEALTAQFADLVQFGKVREDWYALYHKAFADMEQPVGSLAGQQRPAGAKPPAPLATYTGTYRNDFWGPATVTERDGRLELTVGPRGTFELQPWDGNVFTFSFVTENAPPGTVSKATFDGNTLTLEYFDEEHNGVFLR